MNLTLRQAHKAVEKITARLATLDISPTRSVSIWEADEATFEIARGAFESDLERTQRLMLARHFVRQQIGNANFAEVDSLIAQRKLLLDQIGLVRTLVAGAKNRQVTTQEGLYEKVKAMAASAASGGRSSLYGDDTVTITLVDDDQLVAYQAQIDQLQLEIEAVEDKLTAANSSREHLVILSDDVIATLRAEGVIA
jgi:hypothetical protein